MGESRRLTHCQSAAEYAGPTLKPSELREQTLASELPIAYFAFRSYAEIIYA